MVHIATRNNNAFQAQVGTSLTETFTNSLKSATGVKPWESIIDFATHPSFCGLKLYPRQQTLLRLMYLETEHMTAYDLDVIEEWRTNFARLKDRYGVQPDVWQRVEYLKANGYTHFPHIQAVQGRRASKGVIGGILGTERIAYMIALDNPQGHYGIMSESIYLMVIATNSLQAKRFLFADIRKTVANNKWLSKYVSISREQSLSLRTPADIRMIAEMQAKKIPIEYEIASVRVLPMSSISTSGRGAATFAIGYDEMAHMITGTGGNRSSEEVYEAYQPSLDQFGIDALAYIPSSPFCTVKGTKVLTHDLQWVPVETLGVGDEIVAFDEEAPGGHGNGRAWRKAEVTETSVTSALVFEVKTSETSVTCTGEHLWLVRRPFKPNDRLREARGGLSTSETGSTYSGLKWVKTSDLRQGDEIRYMGKPWEQDRSWDGGYLAGIFDGEGSYSRNSQGCILSFAQNPGVVAEDTVALLDSGGFDISIDNKGVDKKCVGYRINGGVEEAARFLGTYRPKRLLERWLEDEEHHPLYGRRAYGRVSRFAVVESVDPAGEQDVVVLGTSTNTLITEGLFSHNSKIGKFFDLYTSGCIPLKELVRIQGSQEDPEDTFTQLTADPTMLIVQLPSWELYRDWERGKQLVGINFKRAVQYSPVGDTVDNHRMARLKQRNPVKFKVEREAQFAEVLDAYLNVDKVDQMLAPFWKGSERWPDGRVLEQTTRGMAAFKYQGHADPSKSNANFAVAVAHLETSPIPDIVMRDGKEHEIFWPHVIVDYMNVWKPEDYSDHTVDYIDIGERLLEIPQWFPTMNMFTFDQYNSPGFVASMRKRFAPRLLIKEETFTAQYIQNMFESFKSALNLGWVHAYQDDLYGSREERAEGMGKSLLELECKFLSEKNGKVVKQEAGPVTTKDLFDCVATVSVRLLKDSLDRWYKEILGRDPLTMGSAGGHPKSGPAGDHMNNNGNPLRRNLSSLESYRYGGSGVDPARGRVGVPAGQTRGWGQRPTGFGLRTRLGR